MDAGRETTKGVEKGMNRTEELRAQVLEKVEDAVRTFEAAANEDEGHAVHLDYITAKRTVELLKKLEAPTEAVWQYYINDEGRPAWRCSNCGKVCHRNPHDKRGCSRCRAHMRMEA